MEGSCPWLCPCQRPLVLLVQALAKATMGVPNLALLTADIVRSHWAVFGSGEKLLCDVMVQAPAGVSGLLRAWFAQL